MAGFRWFQMVSGSFWAVSDGFSLFQVAYNKTSDKIHPIGQPEDGKQCRIVKFTSDSFRERVFTKHKQRKKKPTLQNKKSK